MKTAPEHITVSNKIERLSEEQQQNPMDIFEEFFTTYHLNDAREIFEIWLEAGLKYGTGLLNDPLQQSNLIFFREKLEELLEACYLFKAAHETNTCLQAEHSCIDKQLYAMLTSKLPL